MKYELYTIPNCKQCGDVKNFLSEKNISYDEINLLKPEGKKIFGQIYQQINGRVDRTLHGKIKLPLLVELECERDKKNVGRFAQELKGIEALFG